MVVWLVPMCAQLPSDLSAVAVPAEAPAVVASTVTVSIPEAPVAAAPPAAVPLSPVTIATYRSRSLFPVSGDSYLVSVLRKNHSEVLAEGLRLKLEARVKGQVVERAENMTAQSLAAGATSYLGLRVTTEVFDYILDGPEGVGSGLYWTLTYRLDSDAPDKKRCHRLGALPRRREPAGLTWIRLEESRECEAAK